MIAKIFLINAWLVLAAIRCELSQAYLVRTPPCVSNSVSKKTARIFPQCLEDRHRDLSTSALFESSGSILPQNGEEQAFTDKDPTDLVVVLAPAVMSGLAFALYPETAKGFGDFVAQFSGFVMVDGGKAMSGLIGPALTGPISGLVSILFSTQVSMTISTLYDRQESLRALVASIFDEMQLLALHSDYLPDEYGKRFRKLMFQYSCQFLRALAPRVVRDQAKLDEIRAQNSELLGSMVCLLHDLSEDEQVKENENAIQGANASLRNIIQARSNMETQYLAGFPSWHYMNLGILGGAICVIFLMLTDNPATLFLADFQLRLCWAILIGSFSMLATVLYDLNLPLEGAYQIKKKDYMYKLTPEVIQYWSENQRQE